MREVKNLQGPHGPTTVILERRPGQVGLYDFTVLARTDDGKIEYHASAPDAVLASDVGPGFVRDKSGNLLFDFEESAHAGQVVILRVTPQGINDFGSGSSLAFTSVQPIEMRDVNGDGYMDLGFTFNDCNPDCADAKPTMSWLVWNGSRYVAS